MTYKAIARTESLIHAARQLQAEKPFAAIRVADIVARAGVAIGTFYLSFESVEDLWASFLAEDLAWGGADPREVVSRYMPAKMAAVVREKLL